MRITVHVWAKPDDPARPAAHKEAEVTISTDTLHAFLRGEYPERLQLLIEAAVPQMVRGAIKEAAAR